MKTKTRKVRQWTDEQRQAASARMRETQKIRWAVKEREAAPAVPSVESPQGEAVVKVVSPDVQAVLDTMTPERKAKLAAIQARTIAVLAQSRQGQEALDRLAQAHQPSEGHEAVTVPSGPSEPVTLGTPGAGAIVPPRPGSREVSLVVRNDGTLVSLYGPCVCGQPKRMWHKICLKENPNG